jgi:hypothetical protein
MGDLLREIDDFEPEDICIAVKFFQKEIVNSFIFKVLLLRELGRIDSDKVCAQRYSISNGEM